MPPGGRDRTVIELARRQHGVVSTAQLAAAGLTRKAVAHRVSQGRLTRLHRGVYLVAPLKAPFTDVMAAVLACGDGAVASHRSAAALYGLAPPPTDIEVTVAGRQPRPRQGLNAHRARLLRPDDVTTHHGIPTTTPERTLLDLATVLTQRELEAVVEQAEAQRLLSLPLDEQFKRHRGAKALQRAAREEPKLTRSEAERRTLRLIRKARLPRPAVNETIGPYRVDLLWRRQRLIVEVDGYEFHGTRAAFERDRRRDAHLQAAGYRVLRITWRQITEEPEAVIASLTRAVHSAQQ